MRHFIFFNVRNHKINYTMKINTTPRFFVRNDKNVWLLFLCFLATLQCSYKSEVVVVSPYPNNHFKKRAFDELQSRQRIDKRRARNDFSSLRSSSGFEGRKSRHGCEVDEFGSLEFWNATLSSCIPCTRCSKNKGKNGKYLNLRRCGHDRDTVCGTFEEFHNEIIKLHRKKQLQKGPKLGEISRTLLEPVDNIGRIVHKNNSIISNHANASINKEDSNGGGIRLEHGLVAVGFIIGFGFVFAVGLVYAKVQRVRRYKPFDNANGMILQSS